MALIAQDIVAAGDGLLPTNAGRLAAPSARDLGPAGRRPAHARAPAGDGGAGGRAHHRHHEAGEPRLRHAAAVLPPWPEPRSAPSYGARSPILRPPRLDPAVVGDVRRHIVCGAMPSFWWNAFMCLLMGAAAGGMVPVAYAPLAGLMPTRHRGLTPIGRTAEAHAILARFGVGPVGQAATTACPTPALAFCVVEFGVLGWVFGRFVAAFTIRARKTFHEDQASFCCRSRSVGW